MNEISDRAISELKEYFSKDNKLFGKPFQDILKGLIRTADLTNHQDEVKSVKEKYPQYNDWTVNSIKIRLLVKENKSSYTYGDICVGYMFTEVQNTNNDIHTTVTNVKLSAPFDTDEFVETKKSVMDFINREFRE